MLSYHHGAGAVLSGLAANFTFNYRCCLQFNGLYMYGHDIQPAAHRFRGAPIPLQYLGTAVPVGFIQSRPATFSGGFADVEWLAYPWMYVMIRYDGVNSTADHSMA